MTGRYSKFKMRIVKQQIQDLFSKGKSANDISELLNIDIRTARSYIAEIEVNQDKDIDSSTYSQLDQELSQVQSRLKRELDKPSPNHLLLRQLNDREMSLVEKVKEFKTTGQPPEQYYVPNSNLTDDQADAISDIITGDIDINKDYWQRLLNS